MKKIIKLVLMALLFCSSISIAQDNRTANMTPEERSQMRVDRYNKDLNLSTEQATKLKELFLKQESTRSEGQEKQREFRQNFEKELNKILTPDQQARLKVLREKRRNQTTLPNEEVK